MNVVKHFFNKLEFSFDKDIDKEIPFFTENDKLRKKLSGNVFSFKNNKSVKTQSSFFLITRTLNKEELFEVKRFLWNQDKYDLFFYLETPQVLSLNYSKVDPKKGTAKIDEFKILDESPEKINKIKKWQFDSGAFWANYIEFVNKIKKSDRIDKRLVEQLKFLKNDLEIVIGFDKAYVIQALIDRMLFIKFLEDNHIINSYFYQTYFKEDINYCRPVNFIC